MSKPPLIPLRVSLKEIAMQSMKTPNNVNELYNSPNRKYKKDTVTFESSQFYV